MTGASSGIGRATALALAERGDRLVLAARDAAELDAVAAECEESGGTALAVPTDVAEPAAVERLATAAVERFGRVDAWIGCAGVMAFGRIEDVPAEVHRRVVETNLLGQMNLARAAVPRLRRQGDGALVVVASLYGRITSPYVSAYVATKFGLLGFTEVVRQELADVPGVTVSTLLPTAVDTPIFARAANYTGFKPRPVPPVMPVHKMVRAILRAIDGGRPEVVVGLTGRWYELGHALAPRLYRRLSPRVMRTFGFGRQPAPETTGVVLAPVHGTAAVTGGTRTGQVALRRAALALAAATGLAFVARDRRARRAG